MRAAKELRGLAHDLAHHSQSGMSCLHPHLARACGLAGIDRVELNLLEPQVYPRDLPQREPLRLALGGLQAWFLDLATRLGHDRNSIASVAMRFQFRAGDEHNSAVQATITTADRKEYTAMVNFIGAPEKRPERR